MDIYCWSPVNTGLNFVVRILKTCSHGPSISLGYRTENCTSRRTDEQSLLCSVCLCLCSVICLLVVLRLVASIGAGDWFTVKRLVSETTRNFVLLETLTPGLPDHCRWTVRVRVRVRVGTGSPGHRVNGSFGSSVSAGSPGHRVIIVTRHETRIFSNFPIFEQMLKMHSLHFKC